MKNSQKIISIFCIALLFTQCSSEPHIKDAMNNSKIESSIGYSKTSEITCPECGSKSTEVLPTDVCTIIYTCENCKTELTPKDGDCCVFFCTCGTQKHPSMQDE